MFFWGCWGIVILLFFSSGPWAKPTTKTRGRSGRKKFFCGKTSGHGALLDCRGFLKKFAFFMKILDFREGLPRKRMIFRYFPRLSGPTDGAGGFFRKNIKKNTTNIKNGGFPRKSCAPGSLSTTPPGRPAPGHWPSSSSWPRPCCRRSSRSTSPGMADNHSTRRKHSS